MSWRLHLSHDCCNDFTWGNDESSTRDNLAEILREHLDEMTRTDDEDSDHRDHYTSTTFVEALAFLAKYPTRRQELAERATSGRLTLSPWLCNTLWGSMSPEGQLRAMNQARRLEIELGIPLDCGNHSEMPSLPLGAVPLLAGAGVKWVVVPWLLFDTNWRPLECPPVFVLAGPDGSELGMVFDPMACSRGVYIQALKLLNEPEQIPEWIAWYRALGDQYPLQASFAAGTHHDLYPEKVDEPSTLNLLLQQRNGEQAEAKLVNSSFTRFVREELEPCRDRLPRLNQSFGISWEAWPLALAWLFGSYRLQERAFYDAEALAAIACLVKPREAGFTEAARHRADEVIAMLGDHAWNGMDPLVKRINIDLRQGWVNELWAITESMKRRLSPLLARHEWGQYALFNPLGHRRGGIVWCDRDPGFSFSQDWQPFVQQEAWEDGRRQVAFEAPETPGFGMNSFHQSNPYPPRVGTPAESPLAAWGPLGVGGFLRVVQNTELEVASAPPKLTDSGALFDRWRQTLTAGSLEVEAVVTIWKTRGDLDLDLRFSKPAEAGFDSVSLCLPAEGDWRIQTPGALIDPEQDHHRHADPTRLAMDCFAQRGSLTVSSLEAFLVNPDRPGLVVELFGNRHNRPEVSPDQGGQTQLRFRLRARHDDGGLETSRAARWAAEHHHPLMILNGRPSGPQFRVEEQDGRAISLCLKPSLDGRGLTARWWEASGSSQPLVLDTEGVVEAWLCDLLERDLERLDVVDGKISVPVSGWGYACVRMIPASQ